MDEKQYQKEYDEAAAALEAGQTTPTEAPAEIAEVKTVEAEPVKEVEKVEEVAKAVDPLDEIRLKLEKTEKALKDTQSWGTKNAQELAQLRREREEKQRLESRPQILDANPELEAAIKHVTSTPPAEVKKNEEWQRIVDAAHPGIFDASIEPELEEALMKRLGALGEDVNDPLVAIREITLEKIAFAERNIGKRFAAESAKAAQKSAMSVPTAGASGARTAALDSDLEAKNRILNMSPAEFEKERRRVLGY